MGRVNLFAFKPIFTFLPIELWRAGLVGSAAAWKVAIEFVVSTGRITCPSLSRACLLASLSRGLNSFMSLAKTWLSVSFFILHRGTLASGDASMQEAQSELN
jgi:hypothetical protein